MQRWSRYCLRRARTCTLRTMIDTHPCTMLRGEADVEDFRSDGFAEVVKALLEKGAA